MTLLLFSQPLGILLLISSWYSKTSNAFHPKSPFLHASAGTSASVVQWTTSSAGQNFNDSKRDDSACLVDCDENENRLWNRRTLILSSVGATATLFYPSMAAAANAASADADGNYDCLLDLPPKPPNCVRIYLCRHGQTENNRLGLVQGARMDIPLNYNGEQMAERLGLALGRLDSDLQPGRIFHSPLRRAQQTAEIASSAMSMTVTTMMKTKKNLPHPTQVLESLKEVDFGPTAEGKGISPAAIQTYASWAAGNLDARHEDGESAREVLARCSDAMVELIRWSLLSSESHGNSSIAAISHGMYLRLLLATIMDIPLSQALTMEQPNACINVLDVEIGKYRTSGIGGSGTTKMMMTLPATQVVRLHETRHLEGMMK